MRLKHIKLSGFKSFVDTTKVSVPSNLIGIVGPNGCGKSNVIDAIRWVMGESSAKTLRGASMDDVIFNGSATRKPVGKAFVELVFDNKNGKAPGSYAKYAEIAIRRELTRDGGSKYFINKVKSRRKDVQDIFLGTGLGPRSYSIIEQGMVSRIVESKPEDLRVLIEEAAGISKYKERRRETENRIRHTRDNLSRVEDILSELETQLRRLKRQSNAAGRYKDLKQEQRELDLNLKSLKWATLDEQVQQKDVELGQFDTEYEASIAGQREVEAKLEKMREEQVFITEKLNKVQAEYYSIGGEIASLEQNIEHARQTRLQQQEEFQRLESSEQEARKHLEMDKLRVEEVAAGLLEVTPQVETITEQYAAIAGRFGVAEQCYNEWQTSWENLNQNAAQPEQEREVQKARIEQQQRQIHHFEQRSEQVTNMLKDIDEKINIDEINQLKESVEKIDSQCQLLEEGLQSSDGAIALLRSQLEEMRDQHNAVRHQLQDDSARLNSLKALQKIALGEQNEQLNDWLIDKGIADAPRLATQLQVESGWEQAVDTILGKFLGAVCVDDIQDYPDVSDLRDAKLLMVERNGQTTNNSAKSLPQLLDKVSSSSFDIGYWFNGIYIANDLPEAMQLRNQLLDAESVVTKDGIWLGKHWIAAGAEQDAQSGVLEREAEIERLQDSVQQSQIRLDELQASIESAQESIKLQEQQRELKRSEFRQHSHTRTDLHNQLGRVEARSAELLSQREKFLAEDHDLSNQLSTAQDELSQAQALMAAAETKAHDYQAERTELSAVRDGYKLELEQSRAEEITAREQKQAKQIEYDRLINSNASLQESTTRLEQQLVTQKERRAELEALLKAGDDPGEQYKEALQVLLQKRIEVEQGLSMARSETGDFDNQMLQCDQQRVASDQKAQAIRNNLEQVRMSRQEVLVRRDTIAEGLNENEESIRSLLSGMPDEVTEQQVDEKLQQVIAKIDKIGPVNLVAIDEYEECQERKVYLDKQNTDLVEAMATLEAAIQKIDKETRTRFKETFEKINEGFKEFFPQLFGGGKAYLELTGNDFLDTGVGVMARPPGKRNSTIHLLSGGEKALTAVSLLFAFFDLNPAPFCVLDEVDAPLDDANVERYSQVLKRLGEKTQLLFITHNKITMEVSDILIGVTMSEPGVSRLVTVDVEEAVSMAAQ